jgi:hypothetical protein
LPKEAYLLFNRIGRCLFPFFDSMRISLFDSNYQKIKNMQNLFLTKLTGKAPAWRRTIRAGTYDIIPDMEWLDTYSVRDTAMETETNQMDQNNGSSAVNQVVWQWERNS